MGIGGKVKKGNGNNRGYIGYHTTWDGKYVFLRSKAEFIYARKLDYDRIPYLLEVITYEVNGVKYKPDFFIYDEYDNLNAIVEIKGYLTVNSYKVEKLKKVINTQVSLIQNINLYKIKNINYLKKWKEIRLLELPK